MFVSFSKKFSKQLRQASVLVRNNFESRLTLFEVNIYHPLLHNHALQGKWIGCWSINITGDWRAIYRYQDEDSVMFYFIGTHSQLYRH